MSRTNKKIINMKKITLILFSLLLLSSCNDYKTYRTLTDTTVVVLKKEMFGGKYDTYYLQVYDGSEAHEYEVCQKTYNQYKAGDSIKCFIITVTKYKYSVSDSIDISRRNLDM